jgi:nitronate monooxygenase
MLAGVDYVLMGAGIPREIPAALDALSRQEIATLRLDVEDEPTDSVSTIAFDPGRMGGDKSVELKRPKFVAIVASHSLATTLARKASGRVDGFVIEGPTAGGHNAPARGTPRYNELGEPVYGERDVVDLAKVRELGVPFWMAGGTGAPDELACALAEGASGIQVGTLFAYCDESGFEPSIKRAILEQSVLGEISVLTDPRASPTGYPFKVVQWNSDKKMWPRARLCDLGYLRSAYTREARKIGYRCPAEPVADYVAKGGKTEDTVGRQCVCNGLLAAVGLPQTRENGNEDSPIVTSGNALLNIREFLGDRTHYAARDVIEYLLRSVRPLQGE